MNIKFYFVGAHFTGLIEVQVTEGRYGSASEAIRVDLQLSEEREAKLTPLRAALAEGEASGSPVELDFEAFLEKVSGHGPHAGRGFASASAGSAGGD